VENHLRSGLVVQFEDKSAPDKAILLNLSLECGFPLKIMKSDETVREITDKQEAHEQQLARYQQSVPTGN
jgi:hypothetical protein